MSEHRDEVGDDSHVRVGVVGLGNIGHNHARLLRRGEGRLVGGMDVDADARDRFAAEFGVETYADRADLFETVDAVVVTAPNMYHEEITVDALRAGLDVLVEKPLAHSLESAERIAAAVEEADGFCMVGFHTRFEKEIEILNTYREEGRLGDVTHVDARYVRRRGVPGRGSWFTTESTAGGGALIDIGVHALDLGLYLLGFPDPVEVSGVTRSEFGGREDYAYLHMWGEDLKSDRFDVEDSARALIRCADGRTLSLDVAWATNRPSEQTYVLEGAQAGATFDRAADDLTFHRTDNSGADHMVDATVETVDSDAHGDEQRYFIDHVAAGTTPERNTVEQALTVQRVIDAVYRSADQGGAVRIDR